MNKYVVLKQLLWRDSLVKKLNDGTYNKELCNVCVKIPKTACNCAWNVFNPTNEEMDKFNKVAIVKLREIEYNITKDFQDKTQKLMEIHNLLKTVNSQPQSLSSEAIFNLTKEQIDELDNIEKIDTEKLKKDEQNIIGELKIKTKQLCDLQDLLKILDPLFQKFPDDITLFGLKMPV